MAALAASVFVLLFDNTVMLLLTPSLHFRSHVLFGHAYLHKLIHLHAGLVCGVWVSSTGLGCGILKVQGHGQTCGLEPISSKVYNMSKNTNNFNTNKIHTFT